MTVIKRQTTANTVVPNLGKKPCRKNIAAKNKTTHKKLIRKSEQDRGRESIVFDF